MTRSYHFWRDGEIFVFGSNLAGRHGKGAALSALRYHGAVYGQGIGRQGRAYAIPTKDGDLVTLSLDAIKSYVDEFLQHVREHPNEQFFLTPLGTGLAGYKPADIAPMFVEAPPNVRKPPGW